MALKIILAEDTAPMREALLDVLKGQGHNVVAVNDGVAAEAALAEGADLFITDLLLPKKQGFQLVEGLRNVNNKMPVIIITGVYKTPAQAKDAKDRLGVKEYLIKPFDTDQFLAAVTNALGKGAAPVHSATGLQPVVNMEPMPQSGNLADQPVGLLAFRAQNERHTGVLDLASERERMRLFFFRGALAMVQSSREGRHVGTELVRLGTLSPQGLLASMGVMGRDGVGLYRAMLAEGLVDEAQAKDGYKDLAPRVLMDAVAMVGKFKWTATDAFTKLIPTVAVPVLAPLYDAFKALTPQQLEVLLEKKKGMRLSRGPNFDRYNPGIELALGSDVSRAMNGRARLLQIVGAAQSPQQRAQRMAQAFALLCTQCALAVDAGDGASGGSLSDQVVLPPQPVVMDLPLDAVVPETSSPRFPPPVARAPTQPMQPAAARAVPMPQGAPVPFPVAPIHTPAPVPVAAPPRPAPVAAAANLPPEMAAALKEADQRFAAMEKQNHFEVLGVTEADDIGNVKKAYFALAGKFHADKFSGQELGDSRERLDALFARISQAYETLTKPDKRAEYVTELKLRAAGVQTNLSSIFEAESQFSKAEQVLQRGDFASAKKMLDRAMELDPKDLYKAYQLYATFCAAGRPKTAAGPLIIDLERLGASSAVPRLNEFLAQVAKAGENWQGAKKYWRRIQEDPQSMQALKTLAAREIQLLDKKMEEAKSGGDKGGLMGKFFNKN